MKVIAVFHGSKIEGLDNVSKEVGSNPPMTVAGMEKIRELVPKLKNIKFDAGYASRMARALDTASVLALELDLDFQTMAELGQHGNKDGDNIIMFPGHENEGVVEWQDQGMLAMRLIASKMPEAATVLVVSHRPIIGGLVAAADGVYDASGIKVIINDPSLAKDGYISFEISLKEDTLRIIDN